MFRQEGGNTSPIATASVALRSTLDSDHSIKPSTTSVAQKAGTTVSARTGGTTTAQAALNTRTPNAISLASTSEDEPSPTRIGPEFSN